jgi:hypothetical protein
LQTGNDQTLSLIAAHDFVGALEQLGDSAKSSESSEISFLRARALLVVGRAEEGYAEIRRIRAGAEADGFEIARVYYQSACEIAREKDRFKEAIALLDSSVSLDPSLKTSALQTAWQRGVEYLNSTGSAGLGYMEWAIEKEPDTSSRLRAFDPILSRRFEEMQTMRNELGRYTDLAKRFVREQGRIPASLIELLAAYPEAGLPGRSGWTIGFTAREGQVFAEAVPILGNIFGIKRGTSLISQ